LYLIFSITGIHQNNPDLSKSFVQTGLELSFKKADYLKEGNVYNLQPQFLSLLPFVEIEEAAVIIGYPTFLCLTIYCSGFYQKI
jgi:hypothetical protein